MALGRAGERVVARSKQDPLTGGVDLAVGWTLIACGLIAWTRRPHSRVGPLIAITGFAWFLGTFADSDIDAVATLDSALLTLHHGPSFHAIIGYSSGRLPSRLGIAVVTTCYIVIGNDDTGQAVYLDPDGKVLDAFSAGACNVTIDPADNTYIADAGCGGDQIQVYDPSHVLIGSWSGPDMTLAAPPQFGPNGQILALDRDCGIVRLKVTLPPA